MVILEWNWPLFQWPSIIALHVARLPSNLSPPHSRENRPRPAGNWKYQFESLFGSGLVSSLWKRSPLHAFQMKLFEESICFEFPLFSFWDGQRKYRAQKFFQTVDFFHHNLDTKVLPKGHSNRYLQFHLAPSSFQDCKKTDAIRSRTCSHSWAEWSTKQLDDPPPVYDLWWPPWKFKIFVSWAEPAPTLGTTRSGACGSIWLNTGKLTRSRPYQGDHSEN